MPWSKWSRPEGDEAWEFYDSALKLLGKQERVLVIEMLGQ
jgi:hypothetical protein